MARKPTESHKRKHKLKTNFQAPRKSSRSSEGYRHNAVEFLREEVEVVKKPLNSRKTVERRVKQSKGVKKPSEPKKTVSIAGVFKRAKHVDKERRKRKKRSSTPEPTLAEYFREGINEGVEEARASIDKTLHATFDAQHEHFLRKLSELRVADVKFFESISSTAQMISAPLVEEQIETTFTRDGKRVTEIVEIGKRIELFKKSVEKEEAKLKEYWKQWEDLQEHLVQFGIEVFGPELSGSAMNEPRKGGFMTEMEALDKGHDVAVGELMDQLQHLADEYVTKMKESEWELDASVRRQQAKLLQALISE